MANGFTQRFKGKITASSLWLGGSPQFGPGAYVAYSTAGSMDPGTEKVSLLQASSAAVVSQLAPGSPAQEKLLVIDVSSSIFIKAPAGGGFNGSTLSVFKSTYDMRVQLVAMSSLQWAIAQAYPDTTFGGAPVGGITLSTTT